MRTTSSFKQDFFKKWMTGLQLCNNSKKKMSLLERKNVIKLSADVAMASAKNCSTNWSRALIVNASKNCDGKFLIDKLSSNSSDKINKASVTLFSGIKMLHASKKILKRSKRVCRLKKMAPKVGVKSSIIARGLVKKRTQVLKRLVPGGERIEEFILLEETLDYIMSLKAQIEVMKLLVNASEHLKSN